MKQVKIPFRIKIFFFIKTCSPLEIVLFKCLLMSIIKVSIKILSFFVKFLITRINKKKMQLQQNLNEMVGIDSQCLLKQYFVCM